MKKIIVVRHSCESSKNERREDGGIRLPYNDAARALMSASGYVSYVAKHGYHFTAKLATAESARMVNADGTDHHWSAAEIREATEGITFPEGTTVGDVLYLANMAYADFYPTVIKTEEACIAYAKAVLNDPDGYEGMPFLRWTSDLIGKGTAVDWENSE